MEPTLLLPPGPEKTVQAALSASSWSQRELNPQFCVQAVPLAHIRQLDDTKNCRQS